MKTKIVGLFVCMLLITTILPMTVLAGDEEHPEIKDATGDAFGYIDINSVWFFEKAETPQFLFVSMKINKPSEFVPQQTFAAFWTHNNIEYSCGLSVGFTFHDWKDFMMVQYKDNKDDKITAINGTYNLETGIITYEIPKSIIGNPQKGDVLTNTWSNAFRRLGFIGRIGFTRNILDMIIFFVFGNNMWDYAPEVLGYGLDYIIQY